MTDSFDHEEHELISYVVFYHLDYLKQPSLRPAPVFRHRAETDARRKLPLRLDMTHVQDPLLALAGCYVPQEVSPTSSEGSQDSFDVPEGKPPFVRTRSATPSLEADDGSDDEAIDELDEVVETHLVLHTKVYALAEKYDIPSLKQVSRRKFEMEMACHFDSPDFAEAIEEVYCSTIDSDRGLRDVVLEAFKSHPQLATTQDVYLVIERTPSLKCELFKIEHGLPV